MRLKSYTSDPSSIADYPALVSQDGRRVLTIATSRPLKDDMLVVRFDGIADRDAAQALTNLRLYVDRDRLPAVEDEEFYHADLVGLRAVTRAGAPVGTVIALQNFGAGDLLEVAPAAGETFFVPFTKAFVPQIDLDASTLVVDDEALPGDDEPGEDVGAAAEP